MDARRWMGRIIEEILERYEPDGIVLDYIRFHNRRLRLDEVGEKRFESSLPENCAMAPPPELGVMKLSCFSAVEPVSGWNQWV